MRGKALFLGTIAFMLLIACGSNGKEIGTTSENATFILQDNVYGENPIQEKTLFASPVETDLQPIPELQLQNGEMVSFRIVFPADAGTKVKSVSSGTVVSVQNKRLPEMSEEELRLGMLGKYAIVDIGDGLSIRYAHLSEINVEEGTVLSAGDEIGVVGYSGMALLDSKQPICGIYILKNGLQINPLQYFQIDGKFTISAYSKIEEK